MVFIGWYLQCLSPRGQLGSAGSPGRHPQGVQVSLQYIHIDMETSK